MMSLKNTIQTFQQICSNGVTLVAVSKNQLIEKIKAAHEAGVRHFGENYLNEAQLKIGALNDLNCHWHYIGFIQTKKCKKLAELFDWVQTVCSLKIAQALNHWNLLLDKRQNILIQVKVLPDVNKGGCTLEECSDLIDAILLLPHLKLRGLMTILPLGLTAEEQFKAFETLKKFFDKCNQCLVEPMDTLSMGMSDEYSIALHAGSNMLRIGRAIFGERL